MKKISVLFFLLFAVSSLFAQEPSQANDLISLLTHKRILSQKESDSLKQSQTKFKPTVEAHAMGHVSFKYQDNAAVSNEFKLERAFIFANAQLAPKIDFFGLYYFAPSTISMVHELWGRWKINPMLNIKVGLMKVPLSFENLVPTTQLHTIDFSQALENLGGVTTDVIGANVGRDLGIELSGEFLPKESHHLLFYNVGVFNGSGVRQLRDLNSAKDFSMMLGVQPIKGWKFQASTVLGCATYERPEESIPMGDHTRNRFSAGTQFDSKKFYGRAEYVWGQDAQLKRNGFYVLGIYRPLKFIDIVAVYDWYDRNTQAEGFVKTRYNLGVTVWFNSLCRLQTFYTINDDPTIKVTSNRIMTQLQVGF